MTPASAAPILLTGATGYVGGRLLGALVAGGRRVRCLTRRPEALRPRVSAGTEVVGGDVTDPRSLAPALEGVGAAFYLVHSMESHDGFAARDRLAARVFGEACRTAGVRRIVYLGGLGRGPELSEHLASRQEVGEVLRAAGVPVVEFRASVILGAGSASFELVRALVEKLPVMVTPRWVRTRAQPIAIDDVVDYLLEALEVDLPEGGIFEIGGADSISYGGIMRAYARERGLRRILIPVPVLTPGLSSLWLALVATRHARVGRALIEGVRNETVVVDRSAERVFRVRPRGVEAALRAAIAELPPERPALPPARAKAAVLASILACLSMLPLGRWLMGDAATDWYPGLAKPAWTPPAQVFGPVWFVLYLLMGIAAGRILVRDGFAEARLCLGVFLLQLGLSAAWSGIFFGCRAPGWALAEIGVLWVAVAATILLMSARSRWASLLMVPYLLWLTLAVALNASIWWMNRD